MLQINQEDFTVRDDQSGVGCRIQTNNGIEIMFDTRNTVLILALQHKDGWVRRTIIQVANDEQAWQALTKSYSPLKVVGYAVLSKIDLDTDVYHAPYRPAFIDVTDPGEEVAKTQFLNKWGSKV